MTKIEMVTPSMSLNVLPSHLKLPAYLSLSVLCVLMARVILRMVDLTIRVVNIDLRKTGAQNSRRPPTKDHTNGNLHLHSQLPSNKAHPKMAGTRDWRACLLFTP